MFGHHKEPQLIIPGLAGFYAKMEPVAYTIARVVFGITMFLHGWPKLMVAGPDKVAAAFATNYGLPSWFGYLATINEIVGGGALVIGLFTRFFAASLAIELLIAMLVVHLPKGFAIGGGGYEFVLLLGLVSFYIAIRGAGPYSADAKIGKHL